MKTVIINGFRRGGTNLVWNILCSIEGASTLSINRNNREENVEVGEYFTEKTESDFAEFVKNKKLLIVKGVNDDIKYNELIKKYSSKTYEIGLVRFKMALAESWIRRGHSLDEFIEKHNKFLNDLKENNNIILDFDKIVVAPFLILEKICNLIEEPCPKSITIMSKNIWKGKGVYGPAFDSVGDFATLTFEDPRLRKGYIYQKIDFQHERNLDPTLKDYIQTNANDFSNVLSSSQYIL